MGTRHCVSTVQKARLLFWKKNNTEFSAKPYVASQSHSMCAAKLKNGLKNDSKRDFARLRSFWHIRCCLICNVLFTPISSPYELEIRSVERGICPIATLYI